MEKLQFSPRKQQQKSYSSGDPATENVRPVPGDRETCSACRWPPSWLSSCDGTHLAGAPSTCAGPRGWRPAAPGPPRSGLGFLRANEDRGPPLARAVPHGMANGSAACK